MDKASRAHHHKELLNNPLFQELTDWIDEQENLAVGAIKLPPESNANPGWFANREQLIGASNQTDDIKSFIAQLPDNTED
tara:strand:- start:32549 stop:32788 length:240 start_codon:yes stop_codon:yes gene_type:complete